MQNLKKNKRKENRKRSTSAKEPYLKLYFRYHESEKWKNASIHESEISSILSIFWLFY